MVERAPAEEDLLSLFRRCADPRAVEMLDGFGNQCFAWGQRLCWLNKHVLPKLRRGQLTARAREDTPLGPWRPVSREAWCALALDSVGGVDDPEHIGIATGHGVTLFDVRISSPSAAFQESDRRPVSAAQLTEFLRNYAAARKPGDPALTERNMLQAAKLEFPDHVISRAHFRECRDAACDRDKLFSRGSRPNRQKF